MDQCNRVPVAHYVASVGYHFYLQHHAGTLAHANSMRSIQKLYLKQETSRFKSGVDPGELCLLFRPVAELQMLQDQGPSALGPALDLELFLQQQRHHGLHVASHAGH